MRMRHLFMPLARFLESTTTIQTWAMLEKRPIPAFIKLLTIALVAMGGLTGVASGQTPGFAAHPPIMNEEYVFRYRLENAGDEAKGEVKLAMSSPVLPVELNQVITLPGESGSVTLRRYIPRAVREQTVVADETGASPSAVLVSIDGPSQSYQRWLIAGDPERNRLSSLIGHWRYIAVDNRKQRDLLFSEFKTERTRGARILVSKMDGSGLVKKTAKSDTVHKIPELGCTVRVKELFHDFAVDTKTAKHINKSDKRMNPAALVEIEHDGRREERLVFAKFPDYGSDTADALPIRVELDWALHERKPVPAYVVTTINKKDNESWSRFQGDSKSEPLKIGLKMPIPASAYTFHLQRFVPSGRLVEGFKPSETKGSVTALEIETIGASGERITTWLEMDVKRIVDTAHGKLAVEFGVPRAAPRHSGISD